MVPDTKAARRELGQLVLDGVPVARLAEITGLSERRLLDLGDETLGRVQRRRAKRRRRA